MSTATTGRQASEARRTIEITDPAVCYYCKTQGLGNNDKFCPNCGFPQKGTQIEMKRFIWNINNKKTLLEEHNAAIKKATNTLFILAGLFTVFGLISGAVNDMDMGIIITNIIIAGIYLGLAFWSKKSAFPAILTGFILYIVIIAINAIVDPVTIVQGIIWKIAIISAFYYGYKGAKEAEDVEKELEIISKAKESAITGNEVR